MLGKENKVITTTHRRKTTDAEWIQDQIVMISVEENIPKVISEGPGFTHYPYSIPKDGFGYPIATNLAIFTLDQSKQENISWSAIVNPVLVALKKPIHIPFL